MQERVSWACAILETGQSMSIFNIRSSVYITGYIRHNRGLVCRGSKQPAEPSIIHFLLLDRFNIRRVPSDLIVSTGQAGSSSWLIYSGSGISNVKKLSFPVNAVILSISPIVRRICLPWQQDLPCCAHQMHGVSNSVLLTTSSNVTQPNRAHSFNR